MLALAIMPCIAYATDTVGVGTSTSVVVTRDGGGLSGIMLTIGVMAVMTIVFMLLIKKKKPENIEGVD
jgi:hypothetical protein